MADKIVLRKSDDGIEVIDKAKLLHKQHVLALRAYGLEERLSGVHYATPESSQDYLMAIYNYLRNLGYNIDSDSSTSVHLKTISRVQEDFEAAKHDGERIKHDKDLPPVRPPSFRPNISIKPYQLRSIHHMIETTHAANFSVPGSGKTLMTYAVFDILKKRGDVESILVVGPLSSFGPWEQEYKFCTGKNPKNNILRYHGQNRKRHLKDIRQYTVVITSYDTAANDSDWLKRHLLSKKKVMMVLDESHHIKSVKDDAKHAPSMIELGNYARRRYILSGTPMPHSFEDLWSQITFLWPSIKILQTRDVYKKMLENYGAHDEISQRINFLWTRITNRHLKNDMPATQAKQIAVKMSPEQEAIYAAVERDMWETHKPDSPSIDLFRFRKNRIMRLLQCVSNPKTMLFRDEDSDLDKFRAQNLDTNSNLDAYNETPHKITAAAKLALKITSNNENVVVWTVFVKNVDMLCDEIKMLDPDANPIGISGDVPPSSASSDVLDRESRIDRFKQSTSGILVATVGSIAESISLHKTCRHAIYLERNFNAGQYMQSLSRIYRIGSDKNKPVHFTFLKSVFSDGVTDTIDSRIELVLNERIKQLHKLLDDEFKLHPLDLNTSSVPTQDDAMGLYDDTISMIKEHRKKGKI